MHQTLQGFVIHRNGRQMPLPLRWRLLWKETTGVVGTKGPLGRAHNSIALKCELKLLSLEFGKLQRLLAKHSCLPYKSVLQWLGTKIGLALRRHMHTFEECFFFLESKAVCCPEVAVVKT